MTTRKLAGRLAWLFDRRYRAFLRDLRRIDREREALKAEIEALQAEGAARLERLMGAVETKREREDREERASEDG